MVLCWQTPFFRSSSVHLSRKTCAPLLRLALNSWALWRAEKQRKQELVLAWSHSAAQPARGQVQMGWWAPEGSPRKKKKKHCEIQVMLSGWNNERMINICKFYMVWNVSGWCWKCKRFSFTNYYTKNVTSWEGREKKTEFGFWRNSQEIPPANRRDTLNTKPTETPQFVN